MESVGSLFDASIFCGHYPFRRLPAMDLPDLRTLLRSASIPRGIATPFESIFYRQPWTALEPWLDAAGADKNLLFWLTVNPRMPGWERDLAKAAESLSVAGIRLFPRYHGYKLDDPGLQAVAGAAAELKMPVYLTARLLDDRLHPYPLNVDPVLEMRDVCHLLQDTPQNRWILGMFTMTELQFLSPHLEGLRGVYCDIGCAKPFEFWGDDIRSSLPLSRVVYGTGVPLYYHLGNRISLARSGFSSVELSGILGENLEALLALRGVSG